MEHKIGEIITLPNGRKAEVKVAKSHLFQCSDCVLCGNSICYDLDCDETEREDHTTIYYKEIKRGMTKEEYIKQLDNRVGLCEMCCYFKQCAKEGSLKIKGCDKHPNYKKEE